MKTVAETLSSGINTIADLQESLQLAIQLEFSTIPPYLCAEWSIADGNVVKETIAEIVLQEMGHMALACNMLNAIGGHPSIAKADFVPNYPVTGLPGNVHPDLTVDLLPLGNEALDTFISIEKPEFTPLAAIGTQVFPTIGEFYDAINTAFDALQPPITPVRQVNNARSGAFPITSLADAHQAIKKIKEQGEGTQISPYAVDFDLKNLAHYYRFKEIRQGARLQKHPDGTYAFDGDPIPMPAATPFAPAADPTATNAFALLFSNLLRALEMTWTTTGSLGSSVGLMFQLASEGTALIGNGLRPDFRWFPLAPPAPLSRAARMSVSLAAPLDALERNFRERPRVLRVNTLAGSRAESVYRAATGITPAALAPGFPPTPAHDLVFRNGATITNLLYFNFFIGGQGSWVPADIEKIQSALLAVMTDQPLNNVMQQYFTRQITVQTLGSEILIGRKPSTVTQGDVEDLVRHLAMAGRLRTQDPSRTVFNFFLPSGVVLNDDPAVSTNRLALQALADQPIPQDDEGDSKHGLGGYHGSVHIGSSKFYYAVGAFSEVQPDGTRNGIPVFDAPWKNVVATFYHELQEARTDPDVEDAIRTGRDSFLGWTSRQGEECGDFPVFEANPLSAVFQEVALEGGGTGPVQFQYSNAVHGPEGPIARPH